MFLFVTWVRVQCNGPSAGEKFLHLNMDIHGWATLGKLNLLWNGKVIVLEYRSQAE